MRLFRLLLILWIGVCPATVALLGAEFHLTNGDIVRGEPVSFNDDGMVVRLAIGGYSPQLGWSKLTQETLIELTKNPKAANFVEPFIDTPPVPKDKEKKKKDIVLKPIVRVDRVLRPNFFESILTPSGIGFFLVLFAANLFAAYEIAIFRHRSPALVCGISAVLPLIGPAAFLSMPPPPDAELDAAPPSDAPAAPATEKASTGSLAKVPSMASGLSIAQHEKPAGPASEGPQTYKRGEFTFNRRFFETKFAGFFRVMPSDPDMALVVRTAKSEIVAKRITRISSSEVHVQSFKNMESGVAFAEITEVQVRRHDAKA